MLSNKEIVERIRHLGKKVGLTSDFAICRQCQFENRAVLGKIDTLKTAPRLDTLEKFASGLGVAIEDLVYSRTEADMELSRTVSQLTEYEKTEVVVYAKMIIKEKNEKAKKVA